MKKPWRTCREVTALISAREDRALALHERLVVRVHKMICDGCVRWDQQVSFMRRSMNAWRNYKG
jgi:Putative zinc-finger